MRKSFFVTGTDTGVGKTLISAALLHAYMARGRKVVGMKPIAAGVEVTADGEVYGDIEALRSASNVGASANDINPYRFRLPIAPHIAAEQAGTAIDLAVIQRAYQRLTAAAEVVIVEGVGGLLVPLGPKIDTSDIAAQLQLPIILVVGVRLGCLNHALLTERAVADKGLHLAGWVANAIEPTMPVQAENIGALRERIDAPLLGCVPYMQAPDARYVATLLTCP